MFTVIAPAAQVIEIFIHPIARVWPRGGNLVVVGNVQYILPLGNIHINSPNLRYFRCWGLFLVFSCWHTQENSQGFLKEGLQE